MYIYAITYTKMTMEIYEKKLYYLKVFQDKEDRYE